MDRLVAMRTFVEIVDAGSLTAAADRLEKSQSSVVRMLAALEAHLGVVLLRRTTRRMSLTPEGVEYLDRCRSILADIDEAERAAGDRSAAPRGALRVTAPVLFGQLHVAPAVSAFVERFPEVSIDVLLFDRMVDLVEEGIDLALRIGPLADSSMVAIPVGEVRRVVCASPALIERLGRPAHPRLLATLPCVRQENPPGPWSFMDDGRPFSVRVDGPLAFNQVGAGVAACAAGAGFGRYFSYQVADLVEAGTLVRVLREFEPEPVPVSLVRAGARRTSTRLRALIDHLGEALRSRLDP